VNPYVKWTLKSVATTVAAFATAVGTAATDGQITGIEWLIASCGAVVAGLAVFGISNGPDPRPQRIDGTSVDYVRNGEGGEHRSS